MVTKFETKQEIVDYICEIGGCNPTKFRKLRKRSKAKILHNGYADEYMIENKLGCKIKFFIQKLDGYFKVWIETSYDVVKLL